MGGWARRWLQAAECGPHFSPAYRCGPHRRSHNRHPAIERPPVHDHFHIGAKEMAAIVRQQHESE
jgi:hypothetical protein